MPGKPIIMKNEEEHVPQVTAAVWATEEPL